MAAFDSTGRFRGAAILVLGLLSVSEVLGQTNCVPKPSGLVGWWPGDGFAADAAGSNTGTLQGGSSYATGQVGRAFSFNGANGYVQVPDSPLWAFGANDFSIELWANFADASGSRVFVGSDQGQGTQNKWLFWLNNGVLQFHINGAANVLIGSASFSAVLNQWYHVAVTRQSNTYRFFINGSVVSVNTDNNPVPDANAPLTIGEGEGLFYFNGLLDEISIYNRALSSNEVASIYAAGSAGKCFTNDPAPVFIQQPADNTIHIGGTATISGAAMGSPRPAFQWLHNGTPLPGATNASLLLPSVAYSDAGSYVLVASNLFGARQSQSATLSVILDTNCFPKPSGLVAWWPGDGFAADVAGANSGTFQNGPAYGGGEVGPAFLFNGANTYVQVPDSPLWAFGSNDFSIELWANFADASGSRVFVGSDQGQGTQNKWLFWLNNGVLQFHINGAANVLIGSGSFSPVLNQWYHVAVTRQSSAYRFFINGSVVSVDSDNNLVPDANAPLTIGEGEGLFYFSGLLDEICIYNRALSSNEVTSIYTAGGAGKCFTNNPAPIFIQQPSAASAYSGASVTFSGAAMGVPRPAYQWLRDGVPIAGATSATLFFSSLSPDDEGTYTLVATNLFGAQQSQPVTLGVNPHERPAPCSRKTGITISEIMYKPAPRSDTNNLEFLEIYNSNPFFHDISGYRIAGDVTFTFPAQTIIPGGGYFVIAASPSSIHAVYGITNVYGPYVGTLKKSGTVQLLDEQGAILLTIPYSSTYPWPVAADGAGHSIVLANPSYGEEDPRAWDISDVVGGSPGAAEGFSASSLRHVVINEVLAHTENTNLLDFVELYNHSNHSNDLSGCILTDDPATNKFIIPSGTFIAPRGFLSFNETQLGFGLSASGETIYLLKPDGSRVLDAIQFDAQADGVSFGRWPDGAAVFYPLVGRSPGASNSPILIRDIVINELMYDPISGNDDDQFLELYNKGSNAVSLANWQFTSGISFVFPGNTVLQPNSYLVVARNQTNLFAKYPNLNSANTLGNFSGKLSHNGERVALAMPQSLHGTNTIYVVEDEVTYSTGGRWGQWSAGGGSSLELVDPRANHQLAANWADSDETQKSAWVNIETTGVLDNGANYDPSIDYAQIGLLDVGECLVDNVEVRAGTAGPNLVSNPDFESGLGSWGLQGCHVRSSLENTGYGGSLHSLHIRSSERLWTGGNSCQVALNGNSLASGQTATLRFKARWLRGWPEVLLRLNGNWLEATATMPLPAGLGTPGGPNSRLLTNAGPAIYDVSHTPAVPAANQAVLVTVLVHDPDGVQSLTLNYRLDPSLNYISVSMKDDGTGGDAIPGDGVFSALIPGQNAGQIAAFFLSATDSRSASSRFPALLNDNAAAPECVVFFGDGNPGADFGVYHFWLTQTNVNRWSSLPNLSNESFDATFVTGNRIIYNARGRFAGSPYHQIYDTPFGALCHYKWTFPDDDKLLGATSFNKLHQPGNGPGDDGSLQREQLANSFLRALGVPWLYKRYVAVYVNGNRRGTLMEDSQCPDGDVVKEHFPNDPDGFLFKMQPWFEFAPFPSGGFIGFNEESWCNLMPYTTTGGVKKPARYRYCFEIRRTPDSANNFSNAFSLIDAANSYGSSNYVANMQNMADMENWMRVFAANHAAANQDCFGALTAQNLYGYIGAQGTKYSLLMWDFNEVFDHDAWGPGQNLFVVNSQDPNTANIYNNPTFRRMYWRALKELVNGPLDVANSGALLDAKYNAFLANGINVESPDVIKSWLGQARSSIASQIAAEDTPNFTVNSSILISNNVAYLTGTAPVDVKTIWFNGIEWPLMWTSVTGWKAAVPLQPGTNQFTVLGVDIHGQPFAGASNGVSAVYDGSIASPIGQIVINEIMSQPAFANAQFVELYNNSTNTAYDLSGWQLKGLSYTFPAGSLLVPNGFLVLAANRAAFAAAYGATNLVFDTFDGTLQPDGETLTLVQPGTNTALDVAKVRFSNLPPWPAGTGSSLQLRDPRQDNWRAGNWAAIAATATPGATNSAFTNIPPFPSLWLNEIQPDNLTGITNHAGQHTAWLELYNPGTNAVSLAGLYLANSYTNLSAWPFPAGASISAGEFKIIFADAQTNLSTLNELHTSFVLPSSAGSLALARLFNGQPQVLDYLDYTNLTPNHSYGSSPDGQAFDRQEFYYVTPGGTNNAVSAPLAVSINEWMAGNTHTIQNPTSGKYSDWFELYNYGTNPANLNGYYLANSSTNRFQFAIPSGYTISPHGFLLVWADSKPTNGMPDLHVNFKLNKGGESIGLYGADGAAVDYVNYGAQTDDISEGRYPDGGTLRLFMPAASPRAPNILPPAPSPPRVTAFSSSGSDNSLTFQTWPGHSYRVEFKNDLTAPGWTPLADGLFANGTVMVIADPSPSPSQRFYRIVQLD